MHVWTHMTTNCHTVPKVDGGCDRFDSHEKCISDVSYVHVAPTTLQFLRVPRDLKNSTRLRSTCWWAVPRKLSVCTHVLIQTECLYTCTDTNWVFVHMYWYKLSACAHVLIQTESLCTCTDTNWVFVHMYWYKLSVCAHVLIQSVCAHVLVQTECLCPCTDTNWVFVHMYWYRVFVHMNWYKLSVCAHVLIQTFCISISRTQSRSSFKHFRYLYKLQ